jgi:hypothetical protein
MTSEQRLDRLERIAKLFVRAGLRARRNMKEQDEKINIIINNQIESDERIDRLNRTIERSNAELSRSIERTTTELSRSIEWTSTELSRSIGQRHNGLSQSIQQTRTELSQSMNELAKAQAHTPGRLDALIEIVRRDRNEHSH